MFVHFVGMDEDEEEAVPLPNVNSAILKKVIQWATYHKDDPPPPEDDENKEKRTDDISSWDADFLKVDQGTLFELILVCFLDECVLGPWYACGEQHNIVLLHVSAHTYACKTSAANFVVEFTFVLAYQIQRKCGMKHEEAALLTVVMICSGLYVITPLWDMPHNYDWFPAFWGHYSSPERRELIMRDAVSCPRWTDSSNTLLWKPQNLHELSVQTVTPFCFDHEFADVSRLSMFAYIFVTSAGCLVVNSVKCDETRTRGV